MDSKDQMIPSPTDVIISAHFDLSTRIALSANSDNTLNHSIFVDAANVWGVDYSSAINDSSAIRSATGIGIDWYTPVGPLSFTYSIPLSKASTDKEQRFFFNLGSSF